MAGMAIAQTDNMRTSTSVFDLEAQLAPVTLGTGLQYVAGVGVSLSGSALTGTASFVGTDAPFPVNNVVCSWNVDLPTGTGARTEMRAVNGGTATAWYEIARFGTTPLKKVARIKSDGYGYIADDTLMTNSTWPRIEYRVTLYRNSTSVNPNLRLMSVCYADTNTRIPYVALPNPGVTTSLAVPWRTQNNVPRIWNLICGPTSMSMAEAYYGVDLPTATVAADCYDDYNGIYGNWPFIAQGAAKRGFKSWMFRANDQQPLRDQIALGHPVEIGFACDPGDLPNAPFSSTNGHLILCVGITANGDFICNDPAGGDSRWDHVVYNKDQMAHCWLWHGGGVCIAVMPD